MTWNSVWSDVMFGVLPDSVPIRLISFMNELTEQIHTGNKMFADNTRTFMNTSTEDISKYTWKTSSVLMYILEHIATLH